MTPPRSCARRRPQAMNHIYNLAVDARGRRSSFVLRTTSADRSQTLAASMTGIGSGFVVVLAGISIFCTALRARPRRRRSPVARQTTSI